MILLTNGTILNFNPASVKEKTDIVIEGNKIIKTGKQLSSKYPKHVVFLHMTIPPGGSLARD